MNEILQGHHRGKLLGAVDATESVIAFSRINVQRASLAGRDLLMLPVL